MWQPPTTNNHSPTEEAVTDQLAILDHLAALDLNREQALVLLFRHEVGFTEAEVAVLLTDAFGIIYDRDRIKTITDTIRAKLERAKASSRGMAA